MGAFLFLYLHHQMNSMFFIFTALAAAIGGGTYMAAKSKSKDILFIGDSVTADPNASYPALIKKIRPELNIEVLAKAGQTTSWMLANLPNKLAAKKYGKIFIYGGINDAMNSSIKTSTTLSNLQQMVDLINASGAQPYVILGYEPNRFMDYLKMPINKYISRKENYLPIIEKYKRLQNLYSTELKRVVIIPKINLGTSTADGIHPNPNGQKKIAETINWYL
jgi:lysophospholipase L1-like esterase